MNRKWFLRLGRRWQLMLFFLPSLVYLLVFCYYPMAGVQIAFRDYNPVGGIFHSPWVGLKHFRRFFQSFQFARVLGNTLKISFYSLLVSFPLTLAAALAINLVRSARWKKAVQTVTYMPHFISTVVLVGMLTQLLNPVIGLYGNLYRLLGGEGYPPDILGKSGAFVHLYTWSGVWQNLGWSTIIYLACLAGVDPELHEAAQIDGATRLRRVIHIDFPALLPTASIMLIMGAGSIMNVGFEKAYLMQNSMNLAASEIIATYVYKVGMSGGFTQFSYASAIGLFKSLINCAMLVLFNGLSRRFGQDGGSLF